MLWNASATVDTLLFCLPPDPKALVKIDALVVRLLLRVYR